MCQTQTKSKKTKTKVTLFGILKIESLFFRILKIESLFFRIPNISHMIPIETKDLSVGERKAECVVYNLAHSIRPQLKRNLIKRNLIKFLIIELPTSDKLSHFSNKESSCCLCYQEKESCSYLLEKCFVAEGLLQAMRRKCNIPSWQETKNVCGLVLKYLTRQETSVVSVALLSLWLTGWSMCCE